MPQLVGLDSGPLGLLTHPKPSSEAIACANWLRDLLVAQVRVLLPAIVDYELRREYLLRGNAVSLRKLDALRNSVEFVPLSQDALERAAALWAQVRQAGRPTSDPKALDGDCILAAQVRLIAEAAGLGDDEFIIATTDVGDFPFLAPAEKWQNIIL